ncbi:putative secreted protein (Por secretion system target) [Nonlabens ulvanivorans]|uniref:Secreted protein (Por secretion system target) n=2 Tax=Nonlabens ulvanivorans TaxID=906888 RepID=A0ABX5E5H2_NONUL|nr:putative secreted protein (Por secretion system target) [Nonlabens ulvanivorans]
MLCLHQFFKTFAVLIILCAAPLLFGQVVLDSEVKITDFGLHFNGAKVPNSSPDNGSTTTYDYVFGNRISAHGDCIKTFGDFVFMTWYHGGKTNRHVILTRYNKITGSMVTIQFPHTHTGFQNKWWLGESHNTIAIGISPIDGTIHLIYDMHAYSATKPSNGSLANDYFRYSYSVPNVATVPDAQFTLSQFVQNTSGGYKHLRLNGNESQSEFDGLTYPKFFLNDSDDLFMYIREGGNNNGKYKFTKYDASTGVWSNFIDFNALNAQNQPNVSYNWGLYGSMKYVDGKMRIGFQRRSGNNNDKYLYQNGVYYAYSDDQSGAMNWKNHQGQNFSLPLYDADFIKVMEPGDYVQTTQANQVYVVQGFDWTVTDNGDVHIISRVRDDEFNVTKNLHTYKPAGATSFTTSENFSGAEAIYTAGSDVFIIGLNGGRVRIQKTLGGTNSFTTVYQATTGRTFSHGQVYIKDGKLYYYLMENATGSARPLYLQIIDLDIIVDPFRVSLTAPFDGETFDIGLTVQISADAVDDNGSISRVEFMVDGSLLGQDTTAPYSIDWTATVEAAYNVQAVAYNISNATVSSNPITINWRIDDPNDLTGDIYRIKNFVTGKYLHSVGADVIESDNASNVAPGDKEWEFVQAGNFYNIESKKTDRGILRAVGNPPNDVINTGFGAPREDSDKQFTVIYNSTDNTYQFETRNGANYIYHNVNGVIEHINNAGDRSKWIVESTTLSTPEVDNEISDIRVFPNPAKDEFTILMKDEIGARIQIYNMLGKLVYDKTMNSNRIDILNKGRFNSGIYLIRVTDENQRVFHSKLVIN